MRHCGILGASRVHPCKSHHDSLRLEQLNNSHVSEMSKVTSDTSLGESGESGGSREPYSVTKLSSVFFSALEGDFFKYRENIKSHPTELESAIIWVLCA